MRIRLTDADYADATNSDIGYCRSCGAEKECCEPDARNYTCDECGEAQVFGAEELMFMGEIDLIDDEADPLCDDE